MRSPSARQTTKEPIRFDRLFAVRGLFLLVGVIFISRLFYVQVINQKHYKSLARSEQFKVLEIEPERGTIYMRSDSDIVTLAVNESRFTIFADPSYVVDISKTADVLSTTLGVQKSDVENKLTKKLRYVILAKKVSKDVKNRVESAKLKGIAWKEERIRTYPQGSTGSSVLGFVNDQGDGQYGVEGALNTKLKGAPGSIRAVTDIRGVPLVQNKDNIVAQPKNGDNVILSIDQTIQRITEEQLKLGVESSQAKSGSVIVMEADTGRVAAMASYPSYDPANYAKVEDPSVFKNKAVSDPMEPGSIIKLLTMGAGIDSGAVAKNTSYFDSGEQNIDGSVIRNVAQLGAGTRSMLEVLRYSLNTGAIHVLEQMGDGDINEKARNTWYSYLTDRYLFSTPSTIEQEETSLGVVNKPNDGDGLRIEYANMSFGQGLSVTIQQMASATSALLNGGTYYKPTLVYGVKNDDGVTEQKPVILKSDTVSASTSADMVDLMMQYSNTLYSGVSRDGFVLGGKTGTAQIPKSDGGGYREDVLNATFTGFIGHKKPKYVAVVRIDEIPASAGAVGFYNARPVFIGIATGIMDNVPFTD